MTKILGYMITLTFYGTWLQGDKRGYVKDGKVLGENIGLQESNTAMLRHKAVRLGEREKKLVRDRLLEQSQHIGQEMLAVAVCSNHVHIVVRAINRPHYMVTQMYKRAATNRLRDVGIEGKVWTRGYDVRFCFDEESLKQKIDYVQGHGD